MFYRKCPKTDLKTRVVIRKCNNFECRSPKSAYAHVYINFLLKVVTGMPVPEGGMNIALGLQDSLRWSCSLSSVQLPIMWQKQLLSLLSDDGVSLSSYHPSSPVTFVKFLKEKGNSLFFLASVNITVILAWVHAAHLTAALLPCWNAVLFIMVMGSLSEKQPCGTSVLQVHYNLLRCFNGKQGCIIKNRLTFKRACC